ncbi:endo-1,4-beta-xylanase [Candidatus Bathyarchaeota archaeon]|nr:endo-1,4-beta-xylanase [Candidatus Bathyarchaeota archaeon]
MSRDFLFGVGALAYTPEVVKLFKEAGINYVEAYLSWNMSMNAYYLNALNVHGYRRSGFVLTGHCLVWMVGSYPGIAGADPWNLPSRVKKLNYDQLKKELYEHVYNTVSRYKGSVTYWTINEPFWKYADPFHLTPEQWIEICKISVDAVKKADPEGKILINNLLGEVRFFSYNPIENLKLLRDRSVEFDVIGLEVYGLGRTPDIPLDSNSYPIVSAVSERIDRFSQFKKPIILTEVGIPRTAGQKQTEWIRDLYTMAFSKQYVKGIAWAFPLDDPFIPKSGMFLGQWSGTPPMPTQAYYQLQNLTRSWLTQGIGTTDKEGVVSFKGFAGNYSITVTAEGFKQTENVIHVQEQAKSNYEIRMQRIKESQAPTVRNETANVSSKPQPSPRAAMSIPSLSQEQTYVLIAVVLIVCFATLAIVNKKRLHVKPATGLK